ncbi:MAG TPA: response regulator [Tepidisphaeraceae bacterium]|jgi:CheY-like chemotaxis protein
MLHKKKILVIDDERDLTMLVKLNLERTGRYEVREENRAVRGLAAAREFKPDLVLLDVMMPDLDGGDVLAQLKDDPNLKNVPVVFLTATVLKEEVAKQGGSIGGYPFIPKPFQTEVLLDRIEKTLPPDAAAAATGSATAAATAAGGGRDPRQPRNPDALRREDRPHRNW